MPAGCATPPGARSANAPSKSASWRVTLQLPRSLAGLDHYPGIRTDHGEGAVYSPSPQPLGAHPRRRPPLDETPRLRPGSALGPHAALEGIQPERQRPRRMARRARAHHRRTHRCTRSASRLVRLVPARACRPRCAPSHRTPTGVPHPRPHQGGLPLPVDAPVPHPRH